MSRPYVRKVEYRPPWQPIAQLGPDHIFMKQFNRGSIWLQGSTILKVSVIYICSSTYNIPYILNNINKKNEDVYSLSCNFIFSLVIFRFFN